MISGQLGLKKSEKSRLPAKFSIWNKFGNKLHAEYGEIFVCENNKGGRLI